MGYVVAFVAGSALFILGAGLAHLIRLEILTRRAQKETGEGAESIDEAATTGEWHVEF